MVETYCQVPGAKSAHLVLGVQRLGWRQLCTTACGVRVLAVLCEEGGHVCATCADPEKRKISPSDTTGARLPPR